MVKPILTFVHIYDAESVSEFKGRVVNFSHPILGGTFFVRGEGSSEVDFFLPVLVCILNKIFPFLQTCVFS